MSKIIQALLSGMFFTFILDFFIFLGIFENYIRKYEIDLYYNILFADNQSVSLFLLFSIFFGYITLYKSAKVSIVIIGFLSLLSLSTLIEPVGNSLGKLILMQKETKVEMKRFSYRGDLLYNGRKNITFYDYKLDKILTLDKNKIISED